MDHDTTSNIHQTIVDVDHLYGPQVIQAMINKPEFIFLKRYYYLLHKTIIPNCRITLPILQQYYNISKDVECYISTGTCVNIRVRRLLNFLLVNLDTEKDYMKFCVVINSITVLTNISYRMIAEFRTNGYWRQVQVHPKLIPSKAQPYQHCDHNRSCAKNYKELSHHKEEEVDNTLCDSDNHDWLNCTLGQAATGAVHITDKRRYLSVSNSKNRLKISERSFNELAVLLPTNCYSTVCKLRKMTNFTDVDERMNNILSECDDARHINNQLLSYIINKCADNVVLLCDVLRNVVSTDKKNHLDNLVNGLISTVIPSSSSAVTVTCLPQRQQNISVVSQPSSCATIVSDTHTTISSNPVVTVSVVECLTTKSSVVISNSGQVVPSITTVAKLSPPVTEEHKLPTNIHTNKDFTLLKAHYHTILHSMPDNYEVTVGKLQNYLSDGQICAILSSSNSSIANKVILDCLIERMSCREELLDLCHQLENITASRNMKIVINEIRLGVQQSIQYPIITPVTTNTQSLLSSDQQHHSMSPSINSPLYQIMLSRINLASNSKVLAVLKKNYTRLCHCLPQDYMITLNKLKQLLRLSDDFLSELTNQPNVNDINETIIGLLMTATIKSDMDALQFCDFMEKIVDSKSSEKQNETLRNEILEALSSSSMPIMTTIFTNSTTTTSISQQFTRSTAVHHTSSVSSVKPTKTHGSNMTQSPQGDNTTARTDVITINKFKSENERCKRPTLRDVYKYVVPEYAHNWRYLGALLLFTHAEMEIIFSDFRNDSQECCRNLLSRWLEKNPDASWDQLFIAIDNLPQTPLPEIVHQGLDQIYVIIVT